jgi:hypothetical protein
MTAEQEITGGKRGGKTHGSEEDRKGNPKRPEA